ncbi:MAG: right-handed parallel beta-helix repeat-containing protein [Victivallaceae bacterium]|nr:right-handed parallel beta-helix repeat-containing protein [Victivallaceae bacterium]
MRKNNVLKSMLLVAIGVAGLTVALGSDVGENIVDDHNANGTDTLDDRAAIMAAINAATATGGSKVVIIPKGTFYLDSPIDLANPQYADLTIKGIGRTSLLMHRGGDYAIKLGDGTSSGRADQITLKSFKINGTLATAASAGIEVNYSCRNLFSNLHITGYNAANSGSDAEGGAAIKFKYSWIQTVRECTLTNNKFGIRTGSGSNTANGLNVVDCVIENISDTGIYLQNANAVKISGTTIEGGGMSYGVYANTGRAYAIQNCYFEGVTNTSIYLDNSAYLKGVTISGNFISLSGSDCAININGVQGAKISGNSFSGVPNDAVIKTRANGYVGNVWLIGNNHDVYSGQTMWSGYVYIEKAVGAKFSSGMWEDVQNKTLTYGRYYTLVQDQ